MLPTVIIYTHTDYKDVWPIIFGQLDIYLKNYKKIVFLNKFDISIDQKYKQFFYNEKLNYTDRVKSCLEQIDNEIILFFHEDMPLYNEPKHDIIEEFVNLIKENKADFIRLIKAGISNNFKFVDIHPNLIICETNNLFSIQPTITTTKKLLNIFSELSGLNIWQFETYASNICIKKKYNNCFMASCHNEPKRGAYHWDSHTFPYIATAIVKGKWNLLEYNKELTNLFEVYNIDKNKRGTNLYV